MDEEEIDSLEEIDFDDEEDEEEGANNDLEEFKEEDEADNDVEIVEDEVVIHIDNVEEEADSDVEMMGILVDCPKCSELFPNDVIDSHIKVCEYDDGAGPSNSRI